LGPTRSTLTLTGTDATLVVFGTRGIAFVAEETSITLAEGFLFHSVVEASSMATADRVFGGTRAAGITSFALPRIHTLALSLPKFVEFALTIFAANLLAETFGTGLRAVLTNAAIFALATGFLGPFVEETGTGTRAADLAILEQTWTLHHAFGTGAASCTGALGRVGGSFAGAVKLGLHFRKCRISAEGVEASFSTVTLVRVVADVKVVAIVAYEKLWLGQRLE